MLRLVCVTLMIILFVGQVVADEKIISLTVTAGEQNRNGYFWSNVIGSASGDLRFNNKVHLNGIAYHDDSLIFRVKKAQHIRDGFPDRWRLILTQTWRDNPTPRVITLTHKDRINFDGRRALIKTANLDTRRRDMLESIGDDILSGDTFFIRVYDETPLASPDPDMVDIRVKLKRVTRNYFWEAGNSQKSFLTRARTLKNGRYFNRNYAYIANNVRLTGIACKHEFMIFRANVGQVIKDGFSDEFLLQIEQDWFTRGGPDPDRKVVFTERDIRTNLLRFEGRYLKISRRSSARLINKICLDLRRNDEIRFILYKNTPSSVRRAPSAVMSNPTAVMSNPTTTWGALKQR